MTTLAQAIAQHCAEHQLSLKSLSETSGVPYATLVNLAKKGGLPRKSEQREALRKVFGCDDATWTAILGASGKNQVDIPTDGPLTLQQMVLKALFERGLTEQEFSKKSGIGYMVITGITRRGAKPRSKTVAQLADKLGIPLGDLLAAVERGGGTASGTRLAVSPVDPDAPSLAQLVSERIAQDGVSVAAFARTHNISYISLQTLLRDGEAPRRKSVLEPLQKALGISDAAFALSLAKSRAEPAPVAVPAVAGDAPARHPLHAALMQLVRERHWNLGEFAKAADLAPLTAAKLVKEGEIPGRTATHEKLRRVLGLDPDAYEALVQRSRPDAASSAEVAAVVKRVRELTGEQLRQVQQVLAGFG